MAHWMIIISAASGPFGIAAWRYAPRAFLMLVGGLTKDPRRSEQCERMLALMRKDAKEILSLKYTASPPPLEKQASSEVTVGEAGHD